MDILKYRHYCLSYNWGINRFQMTTYNVGEDVKENRVFITPYGINHPLVLSKKAFWINKDELCIGYTLDTNPDIYRPIFSHSRQRILDRVHNEEIDEDGNKEQNIRKPYKFWNKVKRRRIMVFTNLYKKRSLPIECIKYIIMFIFTNKNF
jgi:hypothetical protein